MIQDFLVLVVVQPLAAKAVRMGQKLVRPVRKDVNLAVRMVAKTDVKIIVNLLRMADKLYLTLNPSYSLRQDGNRVVLYGEADELNQSQDWLSFIHPYYGMLLSFFSLNNLTKNEKINRCAGYFDKSEEYINSILRRLTDNSEPFVNITKNGTRMSFPRNLLLSSSKPIVRNKEIHVDSIKYIGFPDYSTNRLTYPLNINLELTMKCVTDCCYCYANRKCVSGNMLSTERIIELIKEAKENGVHNFDINGGEVMLHPDIKIILTELLRNGFSPLVSTKMPLEKETILFFKSIGLDHFQISLDSADDKILKTMVRTGNGYIEKMASTLNNASKYGIKVDINSVITKYNSEINQVEQLLEFVSGFDAVKQVRLNPAGYSLYKDNFHDIRTSKEQLANIESTVEDWIRKYNLSIRVSPYECREMFFVEHKNMSFNRRAMCTGNVWNIVILPDGKVTICEELYDNPQFVIGNVATQSIGEVWNSAKAHDLFQITGIKNNATICGNCKDVDICRKDAGVCWKMVLMAYGKDSWFFPDPRCPKAPFPSNDFYY